MTTTTDRTATMKPRQIEIVKSMIAEGWSASAIRIETCLSMKQVNAVFALVQGKAAR